jgi:hypothetical protein
LKTEQLTVEVNTESAAPSPFGWHRAGFISAQHLAELDVAPHATIACVSQQKIPGPVEQVALYVPLSPFASRTDGPIAEIKRRLMSLIGDDIYSPGYRRALDLVKTIEANSATDAHTRAIYEQVATQVENLDINESERRYVAGNAAYELDALARRLRKAAAPVTDSAPGTTIDTDVERERFIDFYMTQSPLTREHLTFDVSGFHHPTVQAAWVGWIGAKCMPAAGAEGPQFSIRAEQLTYDDCSRFGIDFKAVAMATQRADNKPAGERRGQ